MLIAPKRLKLRTSNFTGMFPGAVRTLPLKNFSKRQRGQVTRPLNFWALNAHISKTVKAMDFKFDMHAFRDSLGVPLKMFRNGAWPGSRYPLNFGLASWRHPLWTWSASVTISHLLNFFAIFNDRPFKFYTQVKRRSTKDSYIHDGS